MTTSDIVTEPRWMQLIREEAKRTNITAVAVRMEYSRTALSLVLSGKYAGRTDKIAAKAIAVLEPPVTVACPYLKEDIAIPLCGEYSRRKVPTHNPQKMSHWRACQECQNRCKGGSQ